ncbi:MAG: phytanoyl-CoA dioxygenase family protein [Sphingomonas sp.]
MSLSTEGAVPFRGATLLLLPQLDALAGRVATDRAGVRLHGDPLLREIVESRVLRDLAREQIGATARPVRAIFFDKTPETNWALGWHQDRTIAVKAKHVLPGFEVWTNKAGLCHVEPPFSLIERMLTVRIHLDDVDAENAPLLIAPGSHRLGRIAEPEIGAAVARCGTYACIATRGDIWMYATPILHTSARSRSNRHRRVLQLDYSSDDLPQPLEWLGV